jgi:DNA polymerase I-like protein with 3'-5' exonuclease and polymerase domains
MTNQILPTHLLRMARTGRVPSGEVALDTETSGLFVDDGARVSTVSIAWVDDADRYWTKAAGGIGQHQWGGGIVTVADEIIKDGLDKIRVISVAWPYDQGVSNTGKKEDTGQDTLWAEADNQPKIEWDALLEWLGLLRAGLVFHHMKFDAHLMRAGVRRWPGAGIDLLDLAIWDTQNVCSLIYATTVLMRIRGEMVSTTSLKPTSKHLWGLQEGDEQQIIKQYLTQKKLPMGRWDLMPWDTIGRYADQDARLTLRLMHRQKADIQDGKCAWMTGQGDKMTPQEAIERRLAVSKMLTRMERRGLPFNIAGARTASDELVRRAATTQSALPFEPATLPMAKHYWFGDGIKKGITGLGLAPYAQTDTGGPQLNAQIIGKMVADEMPGARAWRDLQKITTADSRWYAGYAGLAGSDGRLRAGVRQNGTVSSRFSVERVQLQAIPHDYKLSGFEILDGIPTPRALIGQGVPDGWKMWELDLANAEARVAAILAGCKRMLAMIAAGVDLHGATATSLFGGKMFGREYFNGTKDDPQWDQVRTVAKRGNFSFIFGVGWEEFQRSVEEQTGIHLTDAEAQRIVRDWNALYPEYQIAIRKHMAKVESRQRSRGYGWVETINGERRWFQQHEEAHKAFNQRVQTNLAQFGIDWWLGVERDLMDSLGDGPVYEEGKYVGRVGMVMVIHDSMVLLVPDSDLGRRLVADAQRVGVELWAERFPGVIGGVDVKEWAK